VYFTQSRLVFAQVVFYIDEMIREKSKRNNGVAYPAQDGNMNGLPVRTLWALFNVGFTKPD
jgi:hypothetical protein